MAPGQFTKLSKFVMRWQSHRSRSQAVQENLLLQTRLCLRLQVHWFQQQHEKKRKKRDFGAASYAFADYPPFFSDFGPRPRPRQATVFHRQRNRGLPLQNLFTDPLFKEQWYLVSTDSNCTNCRDGIRDGNRTNRDIEAIQHFRLFLLSSWKEFIDDVSSKKFTLYSFLGFYEVSDKRNKDIISYCIVPVH